MVKQKILKCKLKYRKFKGGEELRSPRLKTYETNHRGAALQNL